MRLAFLLLFISSFAFGQYGGLFSFAADTSRHGLEFINLTSKRQGTAAKDSVFKGRIVIPYGYNYVTTTWKLVRHDMARSVEATGIGALVSFTPTMFRTDTINVLALEVYVKEGPVIATSTTSKNLTGLSLPQTWTIATGLNLSAGHVFRIRSHSDTSKYVQAKVTSYNSGTGALVMAAAGATIHGTGTFADWDVNLPRVWPWRNTGAIKVRPQIYDAAHADVVIDVSVSFSGSADNFTDRAGVGGKKYFYTGTAPSSTSVTSKDLSVITSPQTFTTQTGLSWTSGRLVKVSSNANPSVNYIDGTVSSYNSGTGAIAITWTGGNLHGSAMATDWDIELREVLDCFYHYSSDGSKPNIHEFYKCTLKSTNIRFKPGESQNVVFTGETSEQYEYGLTVVTAHGNTGTECVYGELADGSHASKGWVIRGIDVNNNDYTQGGTGFRMHPNNGTFNATNWVMKYLEISHIKGRQVANEFFYIGETIDSNTPAYFPIQRLILFNGDVDYSNNEGVQAGSIFDGEVFKITVLHTGMGGTSGQNYNTQYSWGNRRTYWYQIKGITPNCGFQGFTGINGSDQEMFACQITVTAGAANTIVKLYHNNTYVRINYRFFHCDFVTPSQSWFNLYNDVSQGAINADLYVWTNLNAIVSNTTTQHANNSGFDDTHSIFNNKQYSSSSGPGWKDFANQDYRHGSLSSALFSSTEDTSNSSVHPWAKMDFDGYPFFDENVSAGCYGGMPLMTYLH